MNRLAYSAFLLLLATVVAFSGCNARKTSDSEMRRTIIGNWGIEVSNVAGFFTLRPDGSFSGYWSNTLRPKGWRFEGQWGISNGALITTWTNASFWNYTNDFGLGSEKIWKITQLTAEELMFEGNDVAGIWRRKN